jgi:hypothetical protein
LLFGLFACGELGGVPWPVNTVHTTPRKHGLMNHRRTLVIADVDAGIAKGHGGLSIATLLPWKKNLGGRPRRGWRVSKTFCALVSLGTRLALGSRCWLVKVLHRSWSAELTAFVDSVSTGELVLFRGGTPERIQCDVRSLLWTTEQNLFLNSGRKNPCLPKKDECKKVVGGWCTAGCSRVVNTNIQSHANLKSTAGPQTRASRQDFHVQSCPFCTQNGMVCIWRFTKTGSVPRLAWSTPTDLRSHIPDPER